MATSGTLQLNPNTYTTDGAPNRADINWSATWNSSTLQWSVSWNAVAAGNTNSYWVTIFSGTVTFTDANGNVLDTKSMAAQVPKARGGDQLLSGSFVVGVDSLGNQTLNISGRFQIEYNGSGSDNAGTSKGTGSYALDQMAMASTFTVTSTTVGASGGASTVSISRKSSSYTHSVTWTFGSYAHTETGVGTSVTYTIPASWLNAIPSSATGVGSVTVQTYNGSTPIGSAATAQFSVTAAVNPSIGSFTSAPRGAAYNAQITNYQTVYVSGYSTALLTASSVAGAYGSTITKYEFLQNNALIAQYSSSASSYSHTTGTLSGTSIVLSVRVTDSRGRQASASITVTPKSYATPSFSSANAYRCNSSGTAQNDGTYIRVTASAVATPSENSITALTYATKATTSSTWSAEANVGSGVTASGFANTTSYDVRIKATDKLGQSSYRYFTIPTAEYTMDFKVGGKGVAFGKVAETDNLVDSAWQIRSLKSTGDGLDAAIVAKSANNAAVAAYNEANNNYIELCDGSSGNRGLYTADNGWIFKLTSSNILDIPKTLNIHPDTGSWSEGVRIHPYTNGWATITLCGTDNTGDSGTSANTWSAHAYNGNFYLSKNGSSSAAVRAEYSGSNWFLVGGRLYIGNGTEATERAVIANAECGAISMYSHGTTSGNKGVWLAPHGNDTNGKSVFYADTNNNIYQYGNWAGVTIPVSKGGTGATSAKSARSNLNMVCTLLSSSVGSTEATVSSDISEYSAFIITGVPSSNYTATCFVPKIALSTTATKWQLADEARYIGCEVRTSGSSLLVKVAASSTSGKTVAVYGLRGA